MLRGEHVGDVRDLPKSRASEGRWDLARLIVNDWRLECHACAVFEGIL
jgi:hypothetical protein